MTSKFLRHVACEHCGSTDGNSLYDDGHTHCFVCGKTEFENQIEERSVMRDAIAPAGAPTKKPVEIKGMVKSIPDRGITQQTCEKFGVTQDEGKHYYPYHDSEGILVATKTRSVESKSFAISGERVSKASERTV